VFLVGVLVHTYLPWWVSALFLSTAPFAALVVVRAARRAGGAP